MYENLLEFLMGKKSELTEEELNQFMELLCQAFDVTNEYHTLEKQQVIDNIIDTVNIKDLNERKVISSAIDNILQFDDGEISSSSYDDSSSCEGKNTSEEHIPLKERKIKRGCFKKSTALKPDQITNTDCHIASERAENTLNAESSLELPPEHRTASNEALAQNSADTSSEHGESISKFIKPNETTVQELHKEDNSYKSFSKVNLNNDHLVLDKESNTNNTNNQIYTSKFQSNLTNQMTTNQKISLMENKIINSDASLSFPQQLANLGESKAPSHLFKEARAFTNEKKVESNVFIKDESPYKFELGELKEHHATGPEFEFKLDD